MEEYRLRLLRDVARAAGIRLTASDYHLGTEVVEEVYDQLHESMNALEVDKRRLYETGYLLLHCVSYADALGILRKYQPELKESALRQRASRFKKSVISEIRKAKS